MAFSWDMMPGFETPEEYRLFQMWISMGRGHAALRKMDRTIQGWDFRALDRLRVAKFWNDRARERDEWIAVQGNAAAITDLELSNATEHALRRAHAAAVDLVAVELTDLASAALRTGKAGTLRPAEVVKALSLLVAAQRDLAPPPEAKTAVSDGGDSSRLSTDEQLQLRALLAKRRGE